MERQVSNLDLYFGEDYIISDKIKIHQPSINEIRSFGEYQYYGMVHDLTTISSDIKSILFDLGKDYTEVSDLEVFFYMSNGLPPSRTSILFGDIDFTKFEFCRNPENDLLFMWNQEQEISIDFRIHKLIQDYLCNLHGIKLKIEKAGNDFTKRFLIDEDRQKREKQKNEIIDTSKSILLPQISSLINNPCTNFSLEEVKKMKLFMFQDSLRRTQEFLNAHYLTSACYSGNVDTKKINTKKLNWTTDFYS